MPAPGPPGVRSQGRTDRRTMPGYRIQENYGLCGPSSQVEINTTTLLSCSAVILFNAQTGMLGLYHYGALSLTGRMVQAVIRQMINDVAPSRIVLWPANVSNSLFLVSKEREEKSILLDNAKLRTFLDFTKSGPCALEQRADENFPGVKVRDGALSFEPVSGSVTPPANLPEGRTQSGDIWWYHASATGSQPYAQKDGQAVTDILILEHE